jgi:hypothetical protein
MSILRVLNGSGDTSTKWDPAQVKVNDPDALAAVAEAERIFRRARASGAVAFSVAPGKPAQRISEFDPDADEVLIVPPMVGG